jgi:hypothetical protein
LVIFAAQCGRQENRNKKRKKAAGEAPPPSKALTGRYDARASGLRARDVVLIQYKADRLQKGDPNDVVLILAAQLEGFPRTPNGSERNKATEIACSPVRSPSVPRNTGRPSRARVPVSQLLHLT